MTFQIIKYFTLGLTLFFCYLTSNGQNNKTTDSLLTILKAAKDDTNKVNVLYLVGEICPEKDILKYAELALNLSEKLKYKKGIADALHNNSYVYHNRGQIGKALEYYTKSLKIREEIGDKKGVANSLNNIGSIYHDQKQLDKALEYYTKSLKIREEIGDKEGIVSSLNNIGSVYQKQRQLEKALEYQIKSMNIGKEIGDKIGVSNSLNTIGTIYRGKGEQEKALEYYLKALKMRQELHYKLGVAFSLNDVGAIYLLQKNYKEAEKYCMGSLRIAQEIGYPKTIRDASQWLSKIYREQNNYKDAYEMQILFKQMSDSINNEETQKVSMQYEFDKKEALEKAEQNKKDAIANQELKQKEQQRNYFIFGFALVVLLAVFIFKGYRQKQKANTVITEQKKQVDEKQKEILDSIRYARRIQKSLLPTEKYIDKILNVHQIIPNGQKQDKSTGA